MNPFALVRSDALMDERLQKSPAVFMTLCAISTFTTRNKDGYCYFKQETVADKLGKSRQAISQHLNYLSDLGYIEIIPQVYRGFKSNNAYRIKYDGEITDASSPCDVATSHCTDASSPCTTTQAHLAAKCSSINAIKKEKKPLTREGFLRGIDGGYNGGDFQEFEHLTETEIKAAAEACLDFYAAKGEWPAGDPVPVIRHWIRGGIKNGKIRKPAPINISAEGEQEAKSAAPLQSWHEKAKLRIDEKVFRAWIRPLWFDGENLCAPTRFHADRVRDEYLDDLRPFIDAAIIHKPYQPQTERQSS